MNTWVTRTYFVGLAACALVLASACKDQEEPTVEQVVDEFGIVAGSTDDFGKPTFDAVNAPEVAPGKADSVGGLRGPSVAIDAGPTAVWEVTRQWEDVDAEAGIAWGEGSGLTWEQKFESWVGSMEPVASDTTPDGFTFMLTTPWGKTLPAPALECAEVAIFLRVTFASWYNLPFYLEGVGPQGRVFFGHFGMRLGEERFARTPNFRDRYDDFSASAEMVRQDLDAWPSDPQLAAKKIPGSFDDAQPMLGEGAHTGAYFDEIFLNKRAGHFLITTLAYFGSIHLADTRNTFNVKPEAVTAGDVLVERWQATGIGHALLVMTSREAGEVDGQMTYEAELASGSMPRRQPVWESPGASKRSFMLDYTGGPDYANYGGGLKRWRVAKVVDGRWANVVSAQMQPEWINSSDTEAISARPEQFGELLVELSFEQKRDVLLGIIESKRKHLRRFPASCSARIGREEAFSDLYELMESERGWPMDRVDAEFRLLEDHVFAELEYGASKTCCWNSSNAQMYEIIMELNIKNQEDADMCVDVVVFKNRDDDADGYQLFREYAEQTGRGDQWRTWRADESCPQADVAEDTEADRVGASYCDAQVSVTPGDVNQRADFGANVDIPDADPAGIELTAELGDATPSTLLVNVEIEHTWRGDLVIELIRPDGERLELKGADSGDSSDDLSAAYDASALLDGGSVGGVWTLRVVDTFRADVGVLISASIDTF